MFSGNLYYLVMAPKHKSNDASNLDKPKKAHNVAWRKIVPHMLPLSEKVKVP
jgi:hypothetical protein